MHRMPVTLLVFLFTLPVTLLSGHAQSPNIKPSERMTIQELSSIVNSFERCWQPTFLDYENAEDLLVVVRLELGKDGEIVGLPEVVQAPDSKSHPARFRNAAIDDAIRAANTCTPLMGLDKNKHASWKVMHVTLDPGRLPN